MFSHADNIALVKAFANVDDAIRIEDHSVEGREVLGIFDGPAEVFDRGAQAHLTYAPRLTLVSVGTACPLAPGCAQVVARDGGTAEIGEDTRVRVAGRVYRVTHIETERPDQRGLLSAILEEVPGL